MMILLDFHTCMVLRILRILGLFSFIVAITTGVIGLC